MDHLLDSELESDNESLSQDSERHECFICLANRDLVKCCSQCSARVHLRCWQEWRRVQRASIMQMIIHHDERPKNISACTICKTGFACVPGENIEWIWQAETELDVCTEYTDMQQSQCFQTYLCSLVRNSLHGRRLSGCDHSNTH